MSCRRRTRLQAVRPQSGDEISYKLPGLRIEEIHGERHTVVGLTAITPITDETTEVHQIFWATPRWFAPLAPLLKPFMHTFLARIGTWWYSSARALCTSPS